MRLVDEQTAPAYLRETGRIGSHEHVSVRELAGGVSNMVLLVERAPSGNEPGERFVLKQARKQLRTSQPWFSNVERNWREAEVLTICAQLLKRGESDAIADHEPRAQTPSIVFVDRENYLFAMSAAPVPNMVWRDELLAGRIDPRIAAACGRLLAMLHGESWLDGEIAARLGDRTLFDELRVDPYYRTLAAACPAARPAIERLIDSLDRHPRSLVHADFSPKNLLVSAEGLLMVDFETGHYGDPAFDLGFLLSHLVLKACRAIPRHDEFLDLSEVFHQAYSHRLTMNIVGADLADLWARGAQNFAGCAWARLDGKSSVDYLSDPARREAIRAVCREIFDRQPPDWSDVVAICRRQFAQIETRG